MSDPITAATERPIHGERTYSDDKYDEKADVHVGGADNVLPVGEETELKE